MTNVTVRSDGRARQYQMTGGGSCSSSLRCAKQKCFRSEACKTVHREETKKCHPKEERKREEDRRTSRLQGQGAGPRGDAQHGCPVGRPSTRIPQVNLTPLGGTGLWREAARAILTCLSRCSIITEPPKYRKEAPFSPLLQ